MIPISTHSTKPDVVQIHRATGSDMEAVAGVLRDALNGGPQFKFTPVTFHHSIQEREHAGSLASSIG